MDEKELTGLRTRIHDLESEIASVNADLRIAPRTQHEPLHERRARLVADLGNAHNALAVAKGERNAANAGAGGHVWDQAVYAALAVFVSPNAGDGEWAPQIQRAMRFADVFIAERAAHLDGRR